MTPTRGRSFRRSAWAAVLVLILMVTAAPAAHAQQSQDVEVTATVDSYLVITLCDLTANFGSGLTPLGTPPDPPHEVAYITPEGANPGEGVFYIWQGSCPGELFLTVESNLTYDIFTCATENSGTSDDPRVSQGDLRFDLRGIWPTYGSANAFSRVFQDCASAPPVILSREGHFREAVWYYLRVDDGDAPGTFLSTTTWSVVAS
ncbi:MAG: hypothetical protein ACRDJW_09055 [Thermomicrobiales bacterium]